jgi:hypothetical protein
MSNNTNENRVLGRMGARKLTESEADQIAGGVLATPSPLSVIPTKHGTDTSLDT